MIARRPFILAPLALAALWSGCAEPPLQTKPPEIPVFPPPPEQARFFYERSIYGSADVLPDDQDASFRRMVTGEVRSGEGLSKPYGLAVRNGRLYVGDTVDRSVVLFDLNAQKFRRFGIDEPGAVRMPFGIDIDDRGQVYVMDGGAKRVQVYDADGRYLRSLGHSLKWNRPAGLAVDSARKRVYVTDAGGVSTEEHFVRAIDMETGELHFDIGKRGTEPGEFNLPRDAVVAPDGRLFVVDGGNFRVQVFDVDGKYLKTFGAVGRQGGTFSRPKEIAADLRGNVYIVDTAFGNFQIFDPEGRLLLDVGTRGNSDGPARFMLPSGIAVDVDGRVYMVDQYFRKVEVFRPADLPAGSPYGVRRPTK